MEAICAAFASIWIVWITWGILRFCFWKCLQIEFALPFKSNLIHWKDPATHKSWKWRSWAGLISLLPVFAEVIDLDQTWFWLCDSSNDCESATLSFQTTCFHVPARCMLPTCSSSSTTRMSLITSRSLLPLSHPLCPLGLWEWGGKSHVFTLVMIMESVCSCFESLHIKPLLSATSAVVVVWFWFQVCCYQMMRHWSLIYRLCPCWLAIIVGCTGSFTLELSSLQN